MSDEHRLQGDPEEGGALLSMIMVCAVVAALALGVTERAVSEARAVSNSLAQTRAYWAALGMTDYVLSRSMASGGCASNCNSGQIKKAFNGYVGEIGSAMPWMYPEVSAAYQIGLNLTWSADGSAPNGYEYILRATFSACDGVKPDGKISNCPNAPSNSGPASPKALPTYTLPALRTLNTTRPVEIRYCLITAPGQACGTGPTQGTPGYQAITSVHRPSQ